jgi:hypothetical protein
MYQTDVQASQESSVEVANIQMEILDPTPVQVQASHPVRNPGAATPRPVLRQARAAAPGGGGSGCGGGGSWEGLPSRATFLEETG